MTTDSNTPALSVVKGGARVPRGAEVRKRPPSRWSRTNVAGMRPGRLAALLRRVDRGDLEAWADLVEHMLRTDSHLRSVYETLLSHVVSAELRVLPGRGDEELAEDAAEFLREVIADIPRFPALASALLHSYGVGPAVVETQWGFRDGAWRVVDWTKVETRDLRYSDDWVVEVRTVKPDGGDLWLSTSAEPDRWLVAQAESVGMPSHVSGVLQTAVWPWLFKRWALTYQQIGLERLANGLILGKLGTNTHDEARETFYRSLERLTAASIGVIENDQSVEVVEATKTAADAWGPAVDRYNAEMSKVLLGSTLNVEIGSTGGNRAAAESQANTTTLPRLKALATHQAELFKHQLARPALRFNARRFGGMVPPCPELKYQLEQEEPPVVDQLVVDSGAATVDELRASRKLEPWGPERGGDRVLQPLAKTTPSFSQTSPGVGASVPFSRKRPARQMTLPLTSRTSRTSRGSRTQIDDVPDS